MLALQWLWLGMTGGSLVYAALCGRGQEMLAAALEATADAISLTLTLGAGYLLFCGWMRILRALGAPGALERLLRPALRLLMPGVRGKGGAPGRVHESVDEHAGAGQRGHAAGHGGHAPDGGGAQKSARVAHDMYMLLILNATSIQLIPTTVLALRGSGGIGGRGRRRAAQPDMHGRIHGGGRGCWAALPPQEGGARA